jgi:predicted DNA-binding protein (UPF0251 family)
MARPKIKRTIRCNPSAYYFKPRGIPMSQLEEIILEDDEIEAIRLADFQGLFHEDAAIKMKVSRATFGRVLHSARNKIADGILNGKAIKLSDLLKKIKINSSRICPGCGCRLRNIKTSGKLNCTNCK